MARLSPVSSPHQSNNDVTKNYIDTKKTELLGENLEKYFPSKT